LKVRGAAAAGDEGVLEGCAERARPGEQGRIDGGRVVGIHGRKIEKVVGQNQVAVLAGYAEGVVGQRHGAVIGSAETVEFPAQRRVEEFHLDVVRVEHQSLGKVEVHGDGAFAHAFVAILGDADADHAGVKAVLDGDGPVLVHV
jgi:hypothetical protein